jgi:uncharacterized protein YkwD
MTVRNTAQHPAVLILLMSLLLSGCGGGGGSSIAENNAANQDNDSTDSGGDGSGVDSGNIPTSSCQLTSSEVNMLEQVNQARSQARDCGSTHYSATEPLNWDCRLQQAALRHSTDMAENNFFSHTGSDGLGPDSRINTQHYIPQTWGENIAAGYQSIDNAMRAWLDSPGHCRNIMNPVYKDFGIALAQNLNADYNMYWTQEFATPIPVSATFYRNGLVASQSGLSGADLYRYPEEQ